MTLTVTRRHEVGHGDDRHLVSTTTTVGKVKYVLGAGRQRPLRITLGALGRRLSRAHQLLAPKLKVTIAETTGPPQTIGLNVPRRGEIGRRACRRALSLANPTHIY
jgi:hypothetical protein